MSALSIILAAAEGTHLRETAEAALASAAGCGMDAELIVVSAETEESAARQQLHDVPCRFFSCGGESLAAWNNRGADAASAELLLFLQEGVVLTQDGLQKMTETLLLDPQIAAVGPFSNRTAFSWQYLNAERMAAEGEDAALWVQKHLSNPTESLFLEHFALLMRRSAFRQAGGFDASFEGCGGADLDLSFRLKCAGLHLLRASVYLAHRGAEICDLYDLTRTQMRTPLAERWGLDIGVPETLWQEALEAIDWTQGAALVQATCRSALLRTPLVSIMIPTYNRPEYFRETLESARAQVYPNIEIIVCDNSTDDRTQALMMEYRDDLRVRYVRNKDARTKAENFMPFEHLAQGEFLQWCMDDDILLPDKITLMVDLFLRHPSTALVTSVRGAIDGAGTFMGLWEYGLPLHGLYNQFDGAAAGRIMLMKCINFLGEPSAVLFRRRDLTHHYWRAESRGYETISDCAMWLELLEHGDTAVFSRPLSLYRRHGGQEGQQPDAVVLSRIEWRRLIGEYWRRRIFLTEEADYRAALEFLQEECKESVEPLLPMVAPALRREYETGIPSLHIIMMNRVEECAPIRLDKPLGQLVSKGIVSLTGAVQRGDEALDLYRLGGLHDSFILFERASITCSSEVSRLLTAYGKAGNILLQEIDDHPQISEKSVGDNYFSFRAVSAVQTSTPYLADVLRAFNPYVYLFENQLVQLPEPRSYDAEQSRVTIFFGALNRRPDWEPLMPAINEAVRRCGDRLYFCVVSDRGFYEELETAAKEYIGGVRDGGIVAPYERYTAALHASDIALLPLNDTAFNRAKSDLKFIEAAGHGAAVLAAPTVYERTVKDGETGLIYRSPQEFAQKLELLVKRADLRRMLAENAYRYVAEHRLLAQHIDEYAAVYRELFERREELERERLQRVEKFFSNL